MADMAREAWDEVYNKALHLLVAARSAGKWYSCTHQLKATAGDDLELCLRMKRAAEPKEEGGDETTN